MVGLALWISPAQADKANSDAKAIDLIFSAFILVSCSFGF
jgi:hypothetical protein